MHFNQAILNLLDIWTCKLQNICECIIIFYINDPAWVCWKSWGLAHFITGAITKDRVACTLSGGARPAPSAITITPLSVLCNQPADNKLFVSNLLLHHLLWQFVTSGLLLQNRRSPLFTPMKKYAQHLKMFSRVIQRPNRHKYQLNRKKESH